MPSKCLPAQLSAMSPEAEARLRQPHPGNTPKHTVKSLLHELQAHQIELETQKKQLRLLEAALEESRERYSFLYESAPVAYLTLDVSGRITEANRTASTLLGESYLELRHSDFVRLVIGEDQGLWNQNFGLLLKHGGQQQCILNMRRKNGTFFNGHLHYSRISKSGGVPELHIALADITIQKNTEQARWRLEERLSQLTRRERDVLALAIAGIPNKTISSRLAINQRTVENHRARIHKKTGVDSLLELAQQAATAGISLERISEMLA